MKLKRIIALVIAAMLLVCLLPGCNNSAGGGGNSAGNENTEAPSNETNPPAEATLPDHWTEADGAYTYDGEGGESFFLSDTVLKDQDFVYSADVTFEDPEYGLAALIFQSSDDSSNCYIASFSAMTKSGDLNKIENGLQFTLGRETGLQEETTASTYHLQVVMVDTHIAFYVDDVLICSTGDYTMVNDIGQGDALMSGKLGLYGAAGKVTYSNVQHTVYGEGEAPVLTGLTLTPGSGSVEPNDLTYTNGWFVTQEYVSADCDSVTIAPEAASGTDTVVLDAAGAPVSGAVSLNPGQNSFQILTQTGGQPMLSYRLNIIRRGAEPYYSEPTRNLYHYSVKEGWANDPNGLIKIGDTWHFFFQAYPGGTDWGPMHWVHAESNDLIHWEEKGITFYPNEYGTMFSGCAVADPDNVSGLFSGINGVILYITANGNGQRIIAAYSEDGEHWSYYHGTDADGTRNGDDVLIDYRDDPLRDQAFRDPKVFKYQGQWFMVIAGGLLRIYSSTDLIHWNLESTYSGNPGEGENAAGLRVETECPDLVRLPIEGEDGYGWVLSYGGRRYQVGDFNNSNGKWEFVASGEVLPMNFGNDSYAAMTYYLGNSFDEDTQDRVIELNWMNSWDYCNRVDDLSGNTRFNGVYNLNLVESLVRDENGNLVLKQVPAEEYDAAFPESNPGLDTTVSAAAGETVTLDYTGKAYRMDVTITPDAGTAKAGVWVRTDGEKGVSISYDFTTDTMEVDRSTLGGFSTSVRFSQVVAEPGDDGAVTLHIYVDTTCVEAFSGGYTAACAAQIYPNQETNNGVAVFSEGGASSFQVSLREAINTWEDQAA